MTTLFKRFNSLSVKKLLSCKLKELRPIVSKSFSEKLAMSDESANHLERLKEIKEFIPKLTANLHKGQCGRIGIIGGSEQYTGAPYFAAISALKTGADVVYVFCCQGAGPAIKSYSPELIVLPILDKDDAVEKIEPWLNALHSLVIGPGLGRDPGILQNVADIIQHCKEKMNPSLPLIIDADGLYLISKNFKLVQDYRAPVILTPNAVEILRLYSNLQVSDPFQLAALLNVVVVQKGLKDVITNGIHNKKFNFKSSDVTLTCEMTGSYRRCGGQGDILAGCIATLVTWLQLHKLSTTKDFHSEFSNVKGKLDNESSLAWFQEKFMCYSLAAYGACAIVKTCNKLAFEKFGRSMTASDMIPFIHIVFESYFGE